jgi:hypothetical protein
MEKKLKHLEFIHNSINRMSTNSFIIKGWTITLLSAVYVLAREKTKINFSFITFLIAPLFWYLNSYFLLQERKFRALYDVVRLQNENEINFSMNTKKFKKSKCTLQSCILAKSIWPLYSIIIILSILLLKM